MTTTEPKPKGESGSELISPRLRQLAAVLRAVSSEADRRDVINTLLAEIAAQGGTPLIEPVANDDSQVFATFLYAGDIDTTNVYLHADFVPAPPRGELRGQALTRLGDTHLWYYTQKIPEAIRTQYSLLPNDPRIPYRERSEEDNKKFTRTFLTAFDRLNPKRLDFPADPDVPDDFEVLVSICEGPKAPPQLHITARDGVPTGKVELHRFKSATLANERKVWVYTPPGYDAQASEGYPLLLVFDGWVYQSALATPTVLDNLLADGLIPPLVCLLFNNVADARVKELTPNEKLVTAFRDELLPWLREQYHIIDQPEHRYIAGSSFGGLAAAWIALKCPDLFGNVISQSGAYWWFPKATRPEETDDEPGWLIRQYATGDRLPLKFYMDVGSMENADSWEGASHRGLNRHMRDVLRAKGYPVTYIEYYGGHDYLWWRQTLADGLVALQNSSQSTLT